MLCSSIVILVTFDVTSHECAGVDKDHDASPYR
jgi:hypothetical protein